MGTTNSQRTRSAHRPRTRTGRRGVAAATALMLATAGIGTAQAATVVTQTNPGGLVAVGPVNTANGFPSWYQDKDGTRVELCLDAENPLCGFLPGDVPDEAAPISFPDNFPEEAFYMLAGSELDLPGGGRAVLVLGLEAAFANTVTAGDQVVFGRQRVTVRGAPANTTLTFRHPYGTVTIDTDATGSGKLVEDISPAAGNFTTALKSNVGPFLKWDPATAPAAPEGYLGDPGRDHPVVGSPFGYNRFSVTGGGLDVTTDQFSLNGKISTNRGVNADKAVLNGDMIDVFASSGGGLLQVDGQDGKFATTPMVTDPDSGRYYARIKFDGAAPTDLKITNISDKPASNSTVKVGRNAGITVLDANYDGTSLAVSARSASGAALAVRGYGSLATPTTTGGPSQSVWATKAPPSLVTVTEPGGGSVSVEVTVTGGAATAAGLPPVTPAPDPGPVTDPVPPTPEAPAALAAVATPATATVARGASTVLDGSGSTRAVGYQWRQVGGTPVTISSTTVAKPTVTVPFYTRTTDAAPVPVVVNGPVVLELVVTGADGAASAPARVSLSVATDQFGIDAGGRHRLNKEFRVSGTSVMSGFTGTLTPATSVVVYDTTPGRAVSKLGTAQVDALGAWSLKLKPGPARQVTSVRAQSTRGGDASSAVGN